MKRMLASIAALGLIAGPAVAASPTTTKPAAAPTNHKIVKKVAANTNTKAKTGTTANQKKSK